MYALYYKVRWYVGIALLLCLAITVMKYSAWIDQKFFGGSNQPRNVVQQPVQPGSQLPSSTGQSATSPQAAAAPSLPADILTQLTQAKSLLDEASTNATEAIKEVLTWQSEVEPMRTQLLAEPATAALGGESVEADETSKLFDRLAYVMRRERTSAQELRDVASRIESLQLKIDNLLKQSNPPALSAADMAEISQLHATSIDAKDDWQRDVEQTLAIKHLLETQVGGSSNPAAPTTIGKRIEDSDAKAAVSRLDRQIERDQEEEAAREARKARIQREKDLKEQQEAELLAKATSPEVTMLLAPFLEPRTIQPSLAGTFSIKWIRTFDKKPMSLGKLMEIGALDASVEGLKKLALVGGNRKLPEPKWSIYSQPNNWSPDDEERLKRAQQMLREYGPALVKAKLLSE